MDRLDYITENFGGALLAAARRMEPSRSRGIEVRKLVDLIAGYDPTRNKSATQWMVQAYIRGRLPLEDLAKAKETIELFGRVRSRLPAGNRDLGRYMTLTDLWDAVSPFVGEAAEDETPSGKEMRRRERAKAREESLIVHEGDDGFTVAVPMTEYAAKWWGRGTRWCTAGETDNAFRRYHSVGPLLVIIMPDGDKFQLHTAA